MVCWREWTSYTGRNVSNDQGIPIRQQQKKKIIAADVEI